ncbi:MAG: DegV family protein [Dehalococcoidia bacterium]
MTLFRKIRDLVPRRPKEAEAPARPVRIVTDSTADLPPDMARDLLITVVPLQVIFGNESFRDGIDLTTEEFFRKLATATELPQTSQPSVGEFRTVYEELAQHTERIVSIHLSARFSGTVETARLAARELVGRCSIDIIDSGTVSMPMGLAVIAAARAARDGADLDECAAAARSVLRRERLAVALDTLEFLRRGGRIGRAQAFVGGLLRLKPIVTIRNGETFPLARVRTRKKALEALLDTCFEGDPEVQEAVVMQSTTPADADYLVGEVKKRHPNVPVYLGTMGPVIGVHGGPGIIGLAVVLAQPPPDKEASS